MNKKKKIIIFVLVLIVSISGLIIRYRLNSDEGIYVLSEDSSSIKEDKEIDVNKENKTENISSQEVTVYISGAVKEPGIATIKKGDRLANAVNQVGGVTDNADLNQVNLAIKVKDEEHYIIPKIGEKIDNTLGEEVDKINMDNENTKDTSKVNINSSTIEELDTLPGVGEATANKILSYRDENGKFNSIEEIKNVNGIGDKKYQDIKDLISIE